jgi:hypothetical protein
LPENETIGPRFDLRLGQLGRFRQSGVGDQQHPSRVKREKQ